MILAVFILCMTGCNPQPQATPPPSISSSSQSVETLLVEKSSMIELEEHHLEQTAEKYLSDLHIYLPDCTARFLYITTPAGNPVSNIKCCAKTELEEVLKKPYKPYFRGISMENGLLPVSVWNSDIPKDERPQKEKIMFQSSAYTMFLVNTDTDGEPYVQEITVDFTALTETNALSVVWTGPTPEETAKTAEKVVSVTILDSEGKPVSNCFVNANGTSTKLNDGISGQRSREDGRFTNKDGTAYFVIDSSFSDWMQKGIERYLAISVSDSCIDKSYKEVQGTYVCPYPNGELIRDFIFTRNKEEDTLQQEKMIDLKTYHLDQYAEPYLKELKTAFSTGWPECTAKFLYITDPEGQPVANIKCCTKEELETILNKARKPGFRGISMKNGLLPVSVLRAGEKIPAGMFQSTAYTMYLVNTDTDEKPYIQEITVDFTALTETNALTVVWEGPIPEETAKRSEKVTAVTVFDADNEPIPNCFVELEEQREDGRYTDKDGTVFFVIDDTFPEKYQEGPVCSLTVKVSDFALYYPRKESPSAVVDGYSDGKRIDSLNFTRSGEELIIIN